MAQSVDELARNAVSSINLVRDKKKEITGPFESWSLVDLLDILDYVTRASNDLTKLIRREGAALIAEDSKLDSQSLPRPVDYEWLLHAETFYTRLLQRGYLTVGDALKALSKGEVPKSIVQDAATGAYLHEPVREAIQAGYGIKTLEPPKKSI